MYPGNYNIEWLGYKGGEPVEEAPKVGSVAKAWQWRESGINPPNQPPNKTVLENIAEDILVQKPLQITSCDLPGFPRSTFLMVFSPDGTKLASTHGNHNIYVSELASGKHVRILRGHPRTPWCIAFHPSHPQLIGSGCLGGQVRVWDIASGGSEVWNVYNETVIASIAFHPREQLLVIATYNELYFWDWSQPAPFTKVSTKNINEKVRYVAFDSLGFKLITGISLWACSANATTGPLVTPQSSSNSANNNNTGNSSGPSTGSNGPGAGAGNSGNPGNGGPGTGNGNPRGDNPRGDDDNPARPPDTPGAAQDMIVNSYQTLVQRYDSLVRNYQRLFMVRHRLINTPPLANTIDRGTDPMETYPPETARHRRRLSRRSPRASTAQNETASPTPSTSRQPETTPINAPPAAAPSNVINLGDYVVDPDAARTGNTAELRGLPVFSSISSAFHPLGDERTTRLLPNPFSSTNGSPRQPNSSRTSGIFRGGPESALSALRQFSIRRRNLDLAENAARDMRASESVENAENIQRIARAMAAHARTAASNANAAATNVNTAATNINAAATNVNTAATNVNAAATNVIAAATNTDAPMPFATNNPPPYVPPPLPSEPPPPRPPPPPPPPGQPTPQRSGTTSTQTSLSQIGIDPNDPDNEAHTITESLDLIRDILRDSGTRLLNLITNMSMNILSNSERDESARVPVHVFTGNLRRDFMASSSDSEGEHPEVNITRTPNTTFREGEAETSGSQGTAGPTATTTLPQNQFTAPQTSERMSIDIEPPNEGPSRQGRINISDRMTFELEAVNEAPSREGEINVSLSNERFRVRTQGSWSLTPNAPTSTSSVPNPSPASNPTPPVLSTTTNSPISTPASEPNPSTATTSSPVPSTSTATTTAEPQPGPSSAPDPTNFDPNVPSTSRDNFWTQGPGIPAAEAFRRVQMGVTTLQKHTLQLANMWLRGDRTTMRELRTMWEDLRHRILALHREAGGRSDAPSFYTRSLLERCMILTELTEMSDLTSRQFGRAARRNARNAEASSARNAEAGSARNAEAGSARNAEAGSARNAEASSARNGEGNSTTANNVGASTSNATAGPSTSTSNESTSDSRTSRAARSHRIQRNKRLVRLQQAYRWRAEDEVRRRERNAPIFRISHLRSRHRNNLMRTVEQNATRHVIRTRAMKVLSVMFNMMMMCLEERGLSQLIINMLKTLKKALALTCFMMMSNRNMPRTGQNATPASQNVESADVVRIQNVEHSGPVNVDDADDPHSLRVIRYDANADANLNVNPNTSEPTTDPRKPTEAKPQMASTSSTQTTPVEELPSPMPNSNSQLWSHRLAVQIAAANRNNSSTARTRREMYIETRRQKALHRTNPSAHPFIRRRFPPVLSHRIPAMRSLPPGRYHHRVSPRSPPPGPDAAGPLNAPEQPRNPLDFGALPNDEHSNFIRLAHIRLRTAARNRFRRLQTIRLYTPSSVRDMFALQDFQGENRPNPPAEENDPPIGVIFPPSQQLHAFLASEGALPLMQVNDLPPTAEPVALTARRLPRIHEYLQPIILAQNAMVVDDEDGTGGGPGPAAGVHGNRRLGGMAGLLDAGIISEALPAPSHRVQAWDFTTGAAPDIADNTKNVVVQRCRIHNDASIDISKDGRLLVALLPVPRLRNTNNWLGEYHVGVYSLEWPRLGQCLHTAVLEQSAVSVALSPTARYLAVGLGSRRFTSSHSRTNIIALLYKLDPLESSSRTGLSPMKELEQYWEHGFTSLNCLRWAPQPGQGLVYANNTGQLIIMS